MLEQTTTRQNHLIDPVVHVWGWEIPIYLFVGGLVAGMMVIAGYLLLSGRYRNRESAASILPLISLIVLTIGMLALFLDLEHKLYFWRLYTTFEVTSPMSWGAWILLLVYPALVAALLIRPPQVATALWSRFNSLSDAIRERSQAVRWIGIANITLGVMLGIYTGILLSAMGSRPLWNSALLGPLFLTSGLSGAAALVHLVSKEPAERSLLIRADNALLVLELLFIGLFLIGLTSASDAHIRAAGLLLGGPFTGSFWVLVVMLGILFPLTIQFLTVTNRIKHSPVAPLLVIAGGVVLRFIIVYAGQASHV